jgi:hypothetical protein
LSRKNGESEQAIAERKAQMARFVELYRNPAINAAITFLEPLPVSIVVTLVSAGILSRRKSSTSGQLGSASRTAVSM